MLYWFANQTNLRSSPLWETYMALTYALLARKGEILNLEWTDVANEERRLRKGGLGEATVFTIRSSKTDQAKKGYTIPKVTAGAMEAILLPL